MHLRLDVRVHGTNRTMPGLGFTAKLSATVDKSSSHQQSRNEIHGDNPLVTNSYPEKTLCLDTKRTAASVRVTMNILTTVAVSTTYRTTYLNLGW